MRASYKPDWSDNGRTRAFDSHFEDAYCKALAEIHKWSSKSKIVEGLKTGAKAAAGAGALTAEILAPEGKIKKALIVASVGLSAFWAAKRIHSDNDRIDSAVALKEILAPNALLQIQIKDWIRLSFRRRFQYQIQELAVEHGGLHYLIDFCVQRLVELASQYTHRLKIHKSSLAENSSSWSLAFLCGEKTTLSDPEHKVQSADFLKYIHRNLLPGNSHPIWDTDICQSKLRVQPTKEGRKRENWNMRSMLSHSGFVFVDMSSQTLSPYTRRISREVKCLFWTRTKRTDRSDKYPPQLLDASFIEFLDLMETDETSKPHFAPYISATRSRLQIRKEEETKVSAELHESSPLTNEGETVAPVNVSATLLPPPSIDQPVPAGSPRMQRTSNTSAILSHQEAPESEHSPTTAPKVTITPPNHPASSHKASASTSTSVGSIPIPPPDSSPSAISTPSADMAPAPPSTLSAEPPLDKRSISATTLELDWAMDNF